MRIKYIILLSSFFLSLPNVHSSDLIQCLSDLKNTCTFQKEILTRPYTEEVNLVKTYESQDGGYIDRIALINDCKYLTGKSLKKKWYKYSQGDKSWIPKTRVISLDTEVTDTRHEGRIIQLTASENICGVSTGLVFTTYINPDERKISHYAQKVHGISNKKLRSSPSFSEIYEPLIRFISGAVILAHNASFDMRMISQEMERIPGLDEYFYFKCTRWMSFRHHKRTTLSELKTSPLKKKKISYVNPRNRRKAIKRKREKAKAKAKAKEKNSTNRPHKKRKTKKETPSFSITSIVKRLDLGGFKNVMAINGLALDDGLPSGDGLTLDDGLTSSDSLALDYVLTSDDGLPSGDSLPSGDDDDPSAHNSNYDTAVVDAILLSFNQ